MSKNALVRVAVGFGVVGGLVGGAGSAVAAPTDADTAGETVSCPDAECTVTVVAGDVVDYGAGTLTISDVGESSVTTRNGSSRITSSEGGTNTVNGVTYEITEVSDGQAVLVFTQPDED